MQKDEPNPFIQINLSTPGSPLSPVLQDCQTDNGIVTHQCCFVHPRTVIGIEGYLETILVHEPPQDDNASDQPPVAKYVTVQRGRILLTGGAKIETPHHPLDLFKALFGGG